MPRILVALAILAGPLAAQEPEKIDKPEPDAMPKIVTARIEREFLVISEFKTKPVTKEVDLLIEVNGKAAVQRMTVNSSETTLVHRAVPLKKLKAADGAGKQIPMEKLAARLIGEAPVVIHTGPLAAKFRPMFAESAILIEFELPPTKPLATPPK
jgi:hypothetical protein